MADYIAWYLGPVLVALVLSGVLYGCAVVQTYVYYKLFPKDSWKFRILVASEMCLQTAHLASVVLCVWQTVMTNYDRRPQAVGLAMTIAISAVLNGPIAFCTQAFFVFRLYTFSQKKALPAFCSFLVVTQLAFSLMCSIALVATGGLSFDPWGWLFVSMLFITICADTTISVSMSYYLKANEPAFGRTSRVVDRMVLYIMATGTITSKSTHQILITFNIYIWVAFFIIESGCEVVIRRFRRLGLVLISADALLCKCTPTHS
ncbi:hypothetical protein EDC04DRAFT_2028311 [Pisolithus marmoratus]|nr:hypothetical protein EDC04DRAFT_2028311 [Pisolithus marmoratus]